MRLISSIYYFFAPYTDSDERAVGLFFKNLTEHSSQDKTKRRLDLLLQRNIATINLWSEYKYKGYDYLAKSQRRKLYKNLALIAEDFEKFRGESRRSPDDITAHVRHLSQRAKIDPDKMLLIQQIMDYFASSRNIYEYRESSSFGRLLRDPTREKLVGDCNQIVTLYIYLYSRYNSIHDLQIRLLPGHVALHYGGVDIEATSGVFANYDERVGNSIQPIEEIVSVNLLDTTDSYLRTHQTAPEDILQASRFAFILSHDHELVRHNLDAAYSRVINLLMEQHHFTRALKIAITSRDMTLLGVVGHNGAVYEMQQHNYAAARKFAEHSPKKAELIKNSYHAEGAHHFDTGRYHDAIKAFKKLGDHSLVERSYEALFFVEQNKLANNMNSESIKQHAHTIKLMRDYAKKSGNKKLVDHANGLMKYL